MLQLMHFSPRKTAEGFVIQKNEDSSGGKAVKTGLCKRVSAKPVSAAPHFGWQPEVRWQVLSD